MKFLSSPFRGIVLFCTLLIFASSVWAQCTPVGCTKDQIIVGNDIVQFHCVWYDFPNPGQSTWYYKITSGTAPAISHIDFALDLTCLGFVEGGTWGPTKNDLNPGDGLPSAVNPDPTTGLVGVKFDEGFADGEERWYYFTVDANVEASDNQVMASKGGPTFDLGNICGPANGCALICTNGCSAPENISATPFGSHQYQISWDPVVCAIGYQVCGVNVDDPTMYACHRRGTTDKVFNLPPGGNYKFRVRAACNNGDRSTWSSGLLVSVPLRVGQFEPASIASFPNPTDHILYVDLTGGTQDWVIQLTDLTGRIVYETSFAGQGRATLDIAPLNSGMYLLRASDGKQIMVDHIVVE